MTPISMGKNVLADEIPTTLRLKVNDREPELPPHIPPSKAGVDPKRQKRPIQITPQVKTFFCLNLLMKSSFAINWSRYLRMLML